MKLELGTYVDCSELTDEQRQKLLDKFVELVGDCCGDVDTLEDYLECSTHHNLVYFKMGGLRSIWFHDMTHCDIEKSYYDFFPEELETPDTTSKTPVKRVKTIDLERRTKEELVGSIDLSIKKSVDYLSQELDDICIDSGVNSEELLTVQEEDFLRVYKTVFAESEDDYQARIKREKDLNDMYNANVQNLTKKILHLQQDLDDVSAILNGQTTLGASQVMDIKKIIGGK